MKAAVIGVGNMGKKNARIYAELGVLSAVADLNEKLGKEAAEKFQCAYYNDFKEMLEKEKPDAVSVCVPTAYHPSVAAAVIDARVPLLVEKPLALTAEDARKIVARAREKNILLTVGHVERFNPGVQKLKELVPTLGDIVTIQAKRVGLFPSQVADMNVVTDLAVHDIDIICHLLGTRPLAVAASGGRALITKREDYADILLRFPKASGLVSVNWITPIKIRELSVTGTRGHAVLNYITQDIQLYKTNYEKTHDSFGDFVIKFGTPDTVPVPVKKEEPLKMEIQSFLSAVKNSTPPIVTGEEAVTALEIAEQALACIRKNIV